MSYDISPDKLYDLTRQGHCYREETIGNSRIPRLIEWCDPCSHYSYRLVPDYQEIFADESNSIVGVVSAPISTFAVYIQGLWGTQGGIDLTVPPGVQMEIRAGLDRAVSPIFLGNILLPNVNTMGLVVQVCGRLANRWEVWARSIDNGATPARTLPFQVRVLGAQHVGCSLTYQLGSFVTQLPTPPSP